MLSFVLCIRLRFTSMGIILLSRFKTERSITLSPDDDLNKVETLAQEISIDLIIVTVTNNNKIPLFFRHEQRGSYKLRVVKGRVDTA